MTAVLEAADDDFRPARDKAALQRGSSGFRLAPRQLAAECIRLLPNRALRGSALAPAERAAVLADGFEGIDERIDAYLSDVPQDREPDPEAEQFLEWLQPEESPARGEDGDCQPREWTAVELAAIRQRLAHARFQRRWARSASVWASATTLSRLEVVLNPIHVWATLGSAPEMEPDDVAPAEVLFFPVRDEVRSILLGSDAAEVLHDLQRHGPQSVAALLRRVPRRERAERLEVLRRLCQSGAVAIG